MSTPPDSANHCVIVCEAAVEKCLPVEPRRKIEITSSGCHVLVVVKGLEDTKNIGAVLADHVREQCRSCMRMERIRREHGCQSSGHGSHGPGQLTSCIGSHPSRDQWPLTATCSLVNVDSKELHEHLVTESLTNHNVSPVPSNVLNSVDVCQHGYTWMAFQSAGCTCILMHVCSSWASYMSTMTE